MQLKTVMEQYDHYFVLPKSNSFDSFNKKKHLLMGVSRKNKFIALYSYLMSFTQQLLVFIKERPDVVITTGAGFAVPTCLYAHFFGKKMIYIESFARMKTLNKSGKFLYKYADLFIVQWEELLKYYPKAVYGGWIY
jgi:UDP-N-acetylglucosamine:LPS N-acetylglucosamine transferase